MLLILIAGLVGIVFTVQAAWGFVIETTIRNALCVALSAVASASLVGIFYTEMYFYKCQLTEYFWLCDIF